MILSQLQEITSIDSEIVELHEKLQTLYEQRASLTADGTKSSAAASQALDDSIDLSGIDLSL